MNGRQRSLSLCLVVVLLSSFVPLSVKATESPSVSISTHWVGEGATETAHAYTLTFSDNGTFVIEVDMHHERQGAVLATAHTIAWGSDNGVRTALLTFNTSLAWGDTVDLSITITGHNDATGLQIESSRALTVGQWNQPMDDHEVLLSTTWGLDQAYATEAGEQNFSLAFTGQGWQERTGETLSSWELGSGAYRTVESTEEGTTELDLVLTQLWKNETVVGGVMTSQVFDARGFGDLKTTLVDGDTVSSITANVSSAYLNRSVVNGVVGEHLSLEATGLLNVSEETEDASLNIDGELAVFLFEYVDVDGERVLQNTQFEAMADLVQIDDGARLDISLDGFSSHERWVDGVRVVHLNELYGGGTFGYTEQDENATALVNGTIYDFHQKLENGTTLIDDLHVDGTLTGDVQGTFGIVRGIETSGDQANASGDVFLVNVIHQETWFNITGMSGGNLFDGATVGANHNETWDYQVVQSDWDNRTVRMVWRETGAQVSEGEEFPERSPIQRNASPPESVDGLGDLTVGRETGLMPVPMVSNDRLRLADQEGLTLTVTVGGTGVDVRDGHNLTVVAWTGVYEGNDESGVASGTMVSVGPLRGLLSSVERSLTLPFGSENESVVFEETQVLERVLSPEIVSEDDNHAPTIGSVGWRDGLAFGEGGGFAHLEVVVEDSEWNIVSVDADLTSIGLGTVSLNDRGLNGDRSVGDDVYTAAVVVAGLEVGDVEVSVLAADSFGAETNRNATLVVSNLPPRLTEVEIVPASLERGQSAVINIDAYDGHGVASVQVDLREYGGAIVNFTTEGDGRTWGAMVQMPTGMSPGHRSLLVVATDALGASAQQRIFTPSDEVGSPTFGPHHIPSESEVAVEIHVLNDRPQMTFTSATIAKNVDETHVYTVEVSDPDGVERVQINLGVYTPIGGPQWAAMHDDGLNGGDTVAGDGVYSVVLSVREGTPLGTHEVGLRAFDTYGELNTGSSSITLVEDTDLSGSGGGISAAVLGGVGVALLVGVVAVLSLMRQGGGEGGDRFGMQ